MIDTACKTLADRFEGKREQGLRDVKFFLRNQAEAGASQVCDAVNGLYAAMDAGRAKRLDFGDLSWSDTPRDN